MISRRGLVARLAWLAFMFALFMGFSRYAHAQPVPSRAVQARNGARVAAWEGSKLYLRELTGNNDGPEIDAWARANGVGLRSSWCGLFQWAAQQACGLPAPAGAGGSYNWFRDPKRTYYVRGQRGTLNDLKVGERVAFFYTNLGRIGHIGIAVAAARAVRKGRPARGFTVRAGNTGRGGGRDGAGVRDVFYSSADIFAAADWNY